MSFLEMIHITPSCTSVSSCLTTPGLDDGGMLVEAGVGRHLGR